MPPKKPPTQAGKFKPLKRPTKQDVTPSSSGAAASSSSSSSSAVTGSAVEGRGRGAGGRGAGGAAGGRGASGGRNAGGRRGGRGGRAGRFVIPTGAAFFTGEAAKRDNEPRDASSSRGGTTGRGVSSSRGGGSSAAVAAAARAKSGEGEEFIVAEMLDDTDEDDGDYDGGTRKKKSVLEGPSKSRATQSLFDDEINQNISDDRRGGISDSFYYDSDSSAEERRGKRGGIKQGGRDADIGLPPTQLPFPSALHRRPMYDCQEDDDMEEKKSCDDPAGRALPPSKLSDPPPRSPFLNSVSDELKHLETNSWFLIKLPTRLPHLDASSLSSNASKKKVTRIKSELLDEGDSRPDVVGSSHADMSTAGESNALSPGTASGPLGFDDTLKDAATGKYGKIVVRKSGKTELIIGGGSDGPEVRLLLHEGLQCGFRQEAVCIDPVNATFVSLGSVEKSIIVTPDIERAFEIS